MKLFSMVAATVAAGGFFLAGPAESKADHRSPAIGIRIGDFSLRIGGGGYQPVYPQVVVPVAPPVQYVPVAPPVRYVPVAPVYRPYDNCGPVYVAPRPYQRDVFYGPDRGFGNGHPHHHHNHHRDVVSPYYRR